MISCSRSGGFCASLPVLWGFPAREADWPELGGSASYRHSFSPWFSCQFWVGMNRKFRKGFFLLWSLTHSLLCDFHINSQNSSWFFFILSWLPPGQENASWSSLTWNFTEFGRESVSETSLCVSPDYCLWKHSTWSNTSVSSWGKFRLFSSKVWYPLFSPHSPQGKVTLCVFV